MSLATRREFLLLTAAASLGYVSRAIPADSPGGATPVVRDPAIGQSWHYAKRDYFNGELLDTQIDRVTKIGQSIEIESRFESGESQPLTYSSWGAGWWRENMHGDTARAGGLIEVQRPWGMVVVDPHWSEMQFFEEPIPLWPSELRPGWSKVISTHYKIPGSDEAMPWQLTMDGLRWEAVTVPAGRFNAIRYFNFIDFRYSIFADRTAAQRIEHVWFAPEIGRWVKRESTGTFHEQLRAEVNESSYRWELLSWT